MAPSTTPATVPAAPPTTAAMEPATLPADSLMSRALVITVRAAERARAGAFLALATIERAARATVDMRRFMPLFLALLALFAVVRREDFIFIDDFFAVFFLPAPPRRFIVLFFMLFFLPAFAMGPPSRFLQ